MMKSYLIILICVISAIAIAGVTTGVVFIVKPSVFGMGKDKDKDKVKPVKPVVPVVPVTPVAPVVPVVQAPEFFNMTGNNGSCSCNNFCGRDWGGGGSRLKNKNWGGSTADSATISSTGASISIDATSQEPISCLCKRDDSRGWPVPVLPGQACSATMVFPPSS
jgi:hypothetical protein